MTKIRRGRDRIKRLVSIAVLLGVLLCPSFAYAAIVADNAYKVPPPVLPNVDNKFVLFDGNIIETENDTYLPLKEVMEEIGASVIWGADAQDKILIAADGLHYQIELSFDNDTGTVFAGVEDENITYLVQMKNDRAYFPVAFYEEILNRNIKYVPSVQRLNIVDAQPVWKEVVAATKDNDAVYNNINKKIKNLAPYKVEQKQTSRSLSNTQKETPAVAPATAERAEVNGIPIDYEKMVWPTTATRISSPYGRRGGGFHSGVDIDGDTGDPVYAAWTGKVIKAAYSGGYGNCVDIQHADGTVTRYAHMSVIKTSVGAIVERGQVIGEVGSTGRSTGDHLHFEVRKGKATFSPLDYISTSRRVQ